MNKKSGIIKNPIIKIILNVISWTLFTLLILVAVFLLYYAISIQVYTKNGKKYEPPISLYTIISGSMEPNIRVYDVVIDKKVTDPSEIKVGDVITFTSPSSLTYGVTITHRVIAVDNNNGVYRYRTQGDNNLVPDDTYVEFNNVLGKVVLKIPQLGRVQFLLLKAGSWLFLILIPSLGVVIYDILKVLKLAGTKKKIDKTLSKKDSNIISKEEQNKLKQEIKERLNILEEVATEDLKNNNPKIDMAKVLSKINAMDNAESEEDIELPMAKSIDLPMGKIVDLPESKKIDLPMVKTEKLPVVKEKKLPKTKKNTKVPDKKKKYRKKKGR